MRSATSYLLAATLLGVTASACSHGPPAAVPAPQPPPLAREVPRNTSDDDAERARRAAEEAKRAADEAERVRAILAAMIHFDFDRSEVRGDARPVLAAKADLLRVNPTMRLRIEGHADERGSDEYNMTLAMRRALATKAYLVSQGVDAARIETVSFGEEHPLHSDKTENAWAANRRAEFQPGTARTSMINN